MKKLMILIVMFSTQFALGSVLIKKAIKSGNEKIATQVTKYKEACGTNVTVKSDHSMAEKMVMDKRTPENMISVAGGLCSDFISALAEICKDADYKEEINKLKTITCTPSDKITKSPYMNVKKEGATLNIEHNPVKTSGSSSYDALKAAF